MAVSWQCRGQCLTYSSFHYTGVAVGLICTWYLGMCLTTAVLPETGFSHHATPQDFLYEI